jgi:hypothetical protein
LAVHIGEADQAQARITGASRQACGQRAHLGQALQRGLARIRGALDVVEGGDVAEREAGIVVRRTYQTIDIEFTGVAHDGVCTPQK